MLQKSYSIGPESGGIVESAKESGTNVAASAVQMSARPAVIAQGNWKFVEQLLQVHSLVHSNFKNLKSSEIIPRESLRSPRNSFTASRKRPRTLSCWGLAQYVEYKHSNSSVT